MEVGGGQKAQGGFQCGRVDMKRDRVSVGVGWQKVPCLGAPAHGTNLESQVAPSGHKVQGGGGAHWLEEILHGRPEGQARQVHRLPKGNRDANRGGGEACKVNAGGKVQLPVVRLGDKSTAWIGVQAVSVSQSARLIDCLATTVQHHAPSPTRRPPVRSSTGWTPAAEPRWAGGWARWQSPTGSGWRWQAA